MAVPVDGRLLWLGTVASIPEGWSRDFAFDDRALQGGDSSYTGPGDGGGSHEHFLILHGHGGSSHTHDSDGAVTTASPSIFARTSVISIPPVPGARLRHSHLVRTSPVASLEYAEGGDVGGGAIEVFGLHVRAVVIKPDDGDQDIPDGASCFTDESTSPAGFVVEASVDGVVVRGAVPGVGGGSTGGSAEHKHTLDGHTHSVADHEHESHVLGAGTSVEIFADVQNISVAVQAHHLGVLAGGAGGTSGSTAVAAVNESSDPAYVRLLGVTNDSGQASTPVGVVVAYVGAASGIPGQWVLMDGTGESLVDCRDRQIKGTNAVGEIGDSGGVDLHSHGAGHVHGSIGLHNHGLTVSAFVGSLARDAGSREVTRNAAHTHSWTVTSTTPGDADSTDPGTTSVDKRGAYRTVVWIKKVIADAPAGMPVAWWQLRRRRRPRARVLRGPQRWGL